MGKCVSKPSEIHQSVLTLAASEQDLRAFAKLALEEGLERGGWDDGSRRSSTNSNGNARSQQIYQFDSSETLKLLLISTIPGCTHALSTAHIRPNNTEVVPKSTLLTKREHNRRNEQVESQTKRGRRSGEINFSGQTESKKNSKGKHAVSTAEGVQTKGTAMSFGFRKKLNSTTPTKFKKLLEVGDSKHKKQDKCNNKSKGESSRTVIDSMVRDDNGNAEVLTKVDFKKVSATAANANANERRLQATATKPLSPSQTDEENAGNNNCLAADDNSLKADTGVVRASNLKRRSKSAHAGRAGATNSNFDSEPNKTANGKPVQPKTLTFNLNQNKTIEYQRRQFFEQPYSTETGMQANVVLHQTPHISAATYSKFTLQTMSLPKPQFPVSISLNATTPTTPDGGGQPPLAMSAVGGARAKQQHATPKVRQLDQKSAKQIANNSTRRGFSGTREISADSGIASIDMALDGSGSSGGSGADSRDGYRNSSPKRSRSRPRHFQMIMSGRHTFEVRDVDDPPSSESNSFVEPLALPKLPTDSNQMLPLPLNGLVRSNTVLRREVYEHNMARRQAEIDKNKSRIQRNPSSEESYDEEKLYLDCSTSEKSTTAHTRDKESHTSSSKTSSPGSSVMSSWCNGGESLAVKDFSNMSITSSNDGNNDKNNLIRCAVEKDEPMSFGLNDDDISLLNTEMQTTSISETTNPEQMLNNNPKALVSESGLLLQDVEDSNKVERPRSLDNDRKFAEMVLASSTGFLLEDETSPTDSLVSSTESDEMASKLKKHKMNEELQEKDIDEISPELEIGSPISPGTPTHASHSLSLSDCGNLIDDEIADQPALLFNSDKQDAAEQSIASFNEKTETPTLMDTGSLRSLKSQMKSRTALQQAIELSLRTPLSVRKVVMERAESLDTLSPCESICSDDLMMDFDVNSSVDSIDRSSMSVRSRSGSDINKIDETELLTEFERKGSKVMKDLNSLLIGKANRKSEKPSVIANLPARATRLLNRSRLQEQCTLEHGAGSVHSSRSNSAHRQHYLAGPRASTAPAAKRQPRRRDIHSSSDDLMLYDKSFRNAMIQDVLQFKKQLLRLRRILQETETVNPFESDNGQQVFAACGLDSKLLDDFDLASLSSSLSQEPLKELADLRRQVVYLQGQVDDRDRTIRLQRDLIEKLEAEKVTLSGLQNGGIVTKEWINTATQTERTRPLTIGAEGLSRSKPEFTSYTTHFPVLCNDSTTIIRHQQQYPGNCYHALNRTRRHTIISTTLTNYNQQQLAASSDDLHCASMAWQSKKMPPPTMPPSKATRTTQTVAQQLPYKPVRITLIGDLPEASRSTTTAEFSISDVENKRNRINENINNRTAHRKDADKSSYMQHEPTPSSFPQLHCPTVTIV